MKILKCRYSIKITVLIVLLIFALVSISLIAHNYIISNIEDLTQKLEELSSGIVNKTGADVLLLANEIEYDWNRVEKTFHMLLDHNELDKIGTSINRIKSHLETGQNALAYDETQLSIHYLEQFAKKDTFTLSNIL